MNAGSKNVHELFHHYFKQELTSLGLKKKGNSYEYSFSSDLKLRFNVQIDKWGWNNQTGCSFIYAVNPIYKGWSVLSVVPEQIRFYEILQKDGEMTLGIADVMNMYARKASGSLIKRAMTKWTIKKVKNNLGSWFFYYDLEDVEEWFKVLRPSVLDIVKDNIKKLADMDEASLEKSIRQPAVFMNMGEDINN